MTRPILSAGYRNIISSFGVENAESVEPYGNGHINDTFLVTAGSDGPFILQKINTAVFKEVDALMDNIVRVTEFLTAETPVRTLQLKRTRSGSACHKDAKGGVWRMFYYIPGTRVYEKIESPGLAFEVGKAVGEFQSGLAGMQEKLHVTLPGFHDIRQRWKEFEDARQKAGKDRLEEAGDLLAGYGSRLGGVMAIGDRFGDLPERVTHNDTKVNNVLFDRSGKSVCMIDLDTVMPGYVHFDYGDALRTLANTGKEDERDLSKVKFDTGLFKAFTKGYMGEARKFLIKEETELLPFSPVYMTFLIGLRFLTDFLAGDPYYKTSYREHNLIRSSVQMKLLKEMESHFDEILESFI